MPSNWDYLKLLVGGQFKPGMTEGDMLRILAGPSQVADDNGNDLLSKWVGTPALPGDSNWDLIRRKIGPLFSTGDTINDMLRKINSNWSSSSSPVVVYDGSNLVSWSWTGMNPAFWRVSHSVDAGVTWTVTSTVLGSLRQASGYYPFYGGLVMVQGYSALGSVQTGPSNNFSLSQILLSYVSNSALAWNNTSGVLPAHWRIEQALTSDTTVWSTYATLPPTTFGLSLAPSIYSYRVTGIDASGMRMYPYSNVVSTAGGGSTSSFGTPSLSVADGLIFSWTYTGTLPTSWQFYGSVDGGDGGTLLGTIDGTVTGPISAYEVAGGPVTSTTFPYFYMVGVDGSSSPVTPESAVVPGTGYSPAFLDWTTDGDQSAIYLAALTASLIAPSTPSVDLTTIAGNSDTLSGLSSIGDYGWQGAVAGPDGKIYFSPYTADYIAVLDPATNTVDTSTYASVGSGYWGAVLAPNGKIYFIPSGPNCVAILDPIAKTVDTTTISGISGTSWAGGILAPNGKIYCIPYGGSAVGIIDPVTDTIDTTTISGLSNAQWFGAVLGADGKIYTCPNACAFGIIDPVANTIDTTTLPNVEGANYSSAVVAPNGKIYFTPWNMDAVAILDTSTLTFDTTTITGLNSSNIYAGAILGPDGNIYMPTFSGDVIAIVNPSNNTVDLTTFTGMSPNQWWGGVLAPNGNIYLCPDNSSTLFGILNVGATSADENMILSRYHHGTA